MILKVQLPLGGTATRKVLIYNEDRTLEWQLPMTDAFVAMVGNRAKSFWHAKVIMGLPSFDKEAEWQTW